VREDDTFDRAYQHWPTSVSDNRQEAYLAWLKLGEEDRQRAADELGRCVRAMKGTGRKHICSFATYLRDRRWEALPDRPKEPARAAASDWRGPPKPPKPAFLQDWDRRRAAEREDPANGAGAK
jgi:hypothetical protein